MILPSRLQLAVFLLLFTPALLFGKSPPPPDCNFTPDQPITTPAPVDLDQLMKDLSQLRTVTGKTFVKMNAIREPAKKIFDPKRVTSKLHQFYSLLYLIAIHSDIDLKEGAELRLDGVRRVLLTTKTLPNLQFLNQMTKIWAREEKENRPYYQVSFQEGPEIQLPLNKGEGFKSWEDNYCQHIKTLVFDGDFSFYMKKLKSENLLVYDYDHVDLYGDFGTRGMVDVDLNRIELKEVEFYHQSPMAKVTAMISPKEFELNDHTWLLKAVGRIFPNTSVTAVDW